MSSNKYSCPCLNVAFDYTNNDVQKVTVAEAATCFIHEHSNNHENENAFDLNLLKEAFNSLFINNSDLSKNFSNSSKFFKVNQESTNRLDQDHYNSNIIKIKYPSLIGKTKLGSSMPYKLNNVWVNKCMICQLYTHISIKANTNNSSSSSSSSSSNNNQSHSSNSNLLNNFVILNQHQLIEITPETLKHMKENNSYSFIYDICLIEKDNDQSSNELQQQGTLFKEFKVINTQDELTTTASTDLSPNNLNELLKSIQQTYDDHLKLSNTNISDNEKLFKLKFENIIKSQFSKSENTNTIGNSKLSHQLQKTKSTGIVKNNNNNKRTKSLLITQNNNNNYNNFNDIFDFEEPNDLIEKQINNNNNDILDQEPFDDIEDLDENDDDNNSYNNTNNNNGKKNELSTLNVLKKRNSNIDLETTSIGINKQQRHQSAGKKVSMLKYSCSLPREIPNMSQNNRNSFSKDSFKIMDNYEEEETDGDDNPIAGGSDQDDDDIFSGTTENGTYIRRRKSSNGPAYDKNDDINKKGVEYDDEDDDDDDDDENRKDMGRAIRDLASSIVTKDGRELFGGVPSRRVPINSISQSYF